MLHICQHTDCAKFCFCIISWRWLPAALWLLLYVPFRALFQRSAHSQNSLYSNDSLISCFLAFVVFTTEMCVEILIKRWASLYYCLLPLTVPLDWMPANQAIYFPLASFFPLFSFFLPLAKKRQEKSIQRFFGLLFKKPVDFCLKLRSGSWR